MSEITAMVEAIKGLKEAQADPSSPLSKKLAKKQWACEPCISKEVFDLIVENFPELRDVRLGLKDLPPCEGKAPMRICKMPELPAPKRRRLKKVKEEAAA